MTLQYTDIMLDLETLGTGNNAAIIQIGAVAFNADGENASLWTDSPGELLEDGQGFRVNVDLGISSKPGEFDAGAIKFWLGQSAEARASIMAEPSFTLGVALESFVAWVNTVSAGPHKVRLWSNGPTFDEVILRAAFTRYDLDLPISFRGSRCCRTMIEMAEQRGWDRKAAAGGSPDDIVKHDALHDAVFQARGVVSQRHYLRLD